MGHFLGQPNESSPHLERFAAQQAWQSDLLGKSQKNWAVAVDPAVSPFVFLVHLVGWVKQWCSIYVAHLNPICIFLESRGLAGLGENIMLG